MSDRLSGTSAFITGAASGIGRASALLFAAEGARVMACDINADGEKVAAAARQAGGDADFLRADVTNEQEVAAAFDTAAGRLGLPDVLLNCAGGSTDADAAVDSLSVDTLDQVLRVDLRSVILCSRAAIPLMAERGGGSIINMSSFVAFRGIFDIHAYIAAKGALVSLTRAMAGRYARDGIRVNAIAPGIALSERAAARMKSGNIAPTLTFRFDDYPFATGTPEDIANVALFLASGESRMISAQTIVADGGLSSY